MNTKYINNSANFLYAQVKNTPLLSKEGEYHLIRLSQGGNTEARNDLVVSNLRLVMMIAKKYSRYYDFMMLVQEGTIGLIKAIERFDLKSGYRFGTYAAWWVKQRITKSITEKSRTIRLPAHVVEELSKIKRASALFMEAFGYHPTENDLSEYLEVSVDRLRNVLAANSRTDSINCSDSDTEFSLLEVIPGVSLEPSSNIAEREQASMMHKLLKCLKPSQELVLNKRYVDED